VPAYPIGQDADAHPAPAASFRLNYILVQLLQQGSATLGHPMDTEIIVRTARATLAGTNSFPEVVSQLVAAGVEYYHVDYIGMRKTFYSAGGEMAVTAIDYEELPPVARALSVEALRANIFDSQRNGQVYRDFTRRAMEAGVQCYFAFLRGKRVTYLGRTGDQHTEWFPGAEPGQNS
jgi:uncharacterized protein YbcV (DUF1398 family)